MDEQDEYENESFVRTMTAAMPGGGGRSAQGRQGPGVFTMTRWTYTALMMVGIATAKLSRNPQEDGDFVRFLGNLRAIACVDSVSHRLTVMEMDTNFGPIATRFRTAMLNGHSWPSEAQSNERLVLAEYVSVFMAFSKRSDVFSLYALRQVVLKYEFPESLQESATKPSRAVGLDRVSQIVVLRLRDSMPWAVAIAKHHDSDFKKAKDDEDALNMANFNMQQDLVGNTFVSVEQYDQMMARNVPLVRSVFDRTVPTTAETTTMEVQDPQKQASRDARKEAPRMREERVHSVTGPYAQAALKRCKHCLRPRHPLTDGKCTYTMHPQYNKRQPWLLLDCISHRDPGYPDITSPDTLPR